MTDQIIATLVDLEAVIARENVVLESFPFEGLEPLVSSKTRLTAQLDAMLVRLAREQPNWLEALDDDARKLLRGCIEKVNSQSIANEAMLQRQIDYSNEMLAVVTTETQRLANSRSTKYTPFGKLNQQDITTPVSVNTCT